MLAVPKAGQLIKIQFNYHIVNIINNNIMYVYILYIHVYIIIDIDIWYIRYIRLGEVRLKFTCNSRKYVETKVLACWPKL